MTFNHQEMDFIFIFTIFKKNNPYHMFPLPMPHCVSSPLDAAKSNTLYIKMRWTIRMKDGGTCRNPIKKSSQISSCSRKGGEEAPDVIQRDHIKCLKWNARVVLCASSHEHGRWHHADVQTLVCHRRFLPVARPHGGRVVAALALH